MADIFISYARADREKIEKLATALEDEGYSVWWDRNIRGGAQFSAEIEAALNNAKAVIVAWSEAGIVSEWVRDEAAFAREKDKLVPIQIGAVEQPLGFRQRQAIDFINWRGDRNTDAYRLLIDALAAYVAGVEIAPKTASPARPSGYSLSAFTRPAPLAIGAVAIAAIAGVIYFATKPHAGIDTGLVRVNAVSAAGDDEALRVAGGLTEEVLRSLVDRKVDATLSEQSGEKQPKDDLSPEVLVSGAIRREDRELVADMRVDDSRTGETLWSDRFESGSAKTLDFQQDIGDRTSFVVSCAFKWRDPRRRDNRTKILSLYFKACGKLHASNDVSGLVDTTRLLVNAAPGEANAVAFHALALAFEIPTASLEDRPGRIKVARETAETALAINPNSHFALTAMALTYPFGEPNWAEREALFQRAIAIRPDIGALQSVGLIYREVGRIKDALRAYQQAISAEPHPLGIGTAARLLLMTGDREGARDYFERARRYDRKNSLEMELAAQALFGDIDRAEELLPQVQALRNYSDRQVACYIEFFKGRRGEKIDSENLLSLCGDGSFEGDNVRMLAAIGDIDLAYREAEKYFSANNRETIFLFNPEMKAFRRDERFWPMADRMGLTKYWVETGKWPDFCAEPDLPYDCETKAREARDGAVAGR